MVRLSSWVLSAGLVLTLFASINVQAAEKRDARLVDKFSQLGKLLRDPNVYRNAAGAPGPQYWQQRANYHIKASLDEQARTISASGSIEYTNASPDTLHYLWLQLDQNRFKADSIESRSILGSKTEDGVGDQLSFSQMRRHQAASKAQFGYQLRKVSISGGADLAYKVVGTMMKVDLPKPLKPGGKIKLFISWSFNIVERDAIRSRAGYEWFEETDTYIYFIAQWFPRMVAYTDYAGWQHKQFVGRGEFTLEFGDYDVALTVPADHVVAATGELVNTKHVLNAQQRARMDKARSATKPLFIVTPKEALDNEQDKASGEKTWHFKAKNVRDFAWASSRKFIWDAATHTQQQGVHRSVLAQSFYPNEAEPLWSQYSTEAVMHTLDVYSRFSFPYPYPTAQSVNTWRAGGMEYPMITFNGYRPEPIKAEEKEGLVEDAQQSTYKRRVKHSLIGVIIHEIGHIYFPMTVNSDERQWTWMDEGINSFLQHLAELEWEENYYNFSAQASILDRIGAYMVSENQVPIMTQSDSVLQFGPNAYSKPAAALVVLRETVMGRQLFDSAFKEYSRRWKFRRPTPEDFFRTMEDASAVDLDWFWRGWFYSTDHVDVAIESIREYQVSSLDPETESQEKRRLADELQREPIGQIRNREEGLTPRIRRIEGLRDFYNENDQYTVSNQQRNDYQKALKALEPWERRVLNKAIEAGEFIYFIDFQNVGGLVTPLPVRITFQDQSTKIYDIPAEIWRRNPEQVTKLFILPKRLQAIEVDPAHQTADVNRSNNHFPRKILPSRLELFKREDTNRDLMKEMLVKLKSKDDELDDSAAVPLGQPK